MWVVWKSQAHGCLCVCGINFCKQRFACMVCPGIDPREISIFHEICVTSHKF